MSKGGTRLSRLGVLAPVALSACIDASVLAAPAAGAIVSTVLNELSKAFMLKKWFHGVMSSKEAEQLLLQKGRSGSYLVRESLTKPGKYVLSVRVRGRVRHILIRREQNKYDVGSGEIFDDLSDLIEHCRTYPLTETSGEKLRLRQPVSGVRAKQSSLNKEKRKKEEVKPYVDRQSVTDNDPTYAEEFLAVKAADAEIPFTKEQGVDQQHRYKNRYVEALPYDQTMVSLPLDFYTLDDVQTTYINANYIRPAYMFEPIKKAIIRKSTLVRGHDSDWDIFGKPKKTPVEASASTDEAASSASGQSEDPPVFLLKEDSAVRRKRQIEANIAPDKFYIASQGGVPCTRQAFWCAMIDNDVRVVVMLTQLVEDGENKCHHYWPNSWEFFVYNDRKISLDREYENEHYMLRTFNLYDEDLEENTTVYHYQFLNWPDHTVPEKTDGILTLIKDVNERMFMIGMGRNKPRHNILWVHCSAGIGRTGTFIAIDMMIDNRKYAENDSKQVPPKVPDIVKLLRWQRPGMVQNRRQYHFIYKAVADSDV